VTKKVVGVFVRYSCHFTKAITGNALRLQLVSRKHLNTKNLQMKLNDNNIIRLNAGTGFRVVNYLPNHAALTGAREIIIANNLKPEQS
jgi:hypothetical protein